MAITDTYQSLDYLPIYNYVQIINGRLSFLYIDKSECYKELNEVDKGVLSVQFADMCNRYEGKRSTEKIRLSESANEVVVMQALNRLLSISDLCDKGRRDELKSRLMYYGMKMNFNGNNRIIERRIKAIESEEENGDVLSVSALMGSIVSTNAILGTNITHFCETSLYFSYQDQVKKKLDSQNTKNGRL